MLCCFFRFLAPSRQICLECTCTSSMSKVMFGVPLATHYTNLTIVFKVMVMKNWSNLIYSKRCNALLLKQVVSHSGSPKVLIYQTLLHYLNIYHTTLPFEAGFVDLGENRNSYSLYESSFRCLFRKVLQCEFLKVDLCDLLTTGLCYGLIFKHCLVLAIWTFPLLIGVVYLTTCIT